MSEAMRAAATLYNDPWYYSRSEVRIRNNRIRRQRIFRRQIITVSFLISLLIFLFVFLGTSFMSDAQSDDFVPQFKYYSSLTVHAGDTITDIASVYYSEDNYDSLSEYIAEICTLNHISDSNKLRAGEALIVPYYSSEYK